MKPNDMMLYMLGTGDMFNCNKYGCSSCAVLFGDQSLGNKWILVDCGYTVPGTLYEHADLFNPRMMEAVLITHVHGDHVGGLDQLLYSRYFGKFLTPRKEGLVFNADPTDPGTKTKVIATDEVWCRLEPMLRALCGKLVGVNGKEVDGFDAMVKKVSVDVAAASWRCKLSNGVNLFVGPITVEHVPGEPATGFRIQTNGNAGMFWSGDAIFDSELISSLCGSSSDLKIFWDCSTSPKYPGTVHTHKEELLSLPKEILKELVPIHFGDADRLHWPVCLPACITARAVDAGFYMPGGGTENEYLSRVQRRDGIVSGGTRPRDPVHPRLVSSDEVESLTKRMDALEKKLDRILCAK